MRAESALWSAIPGLRIVESRVVPAPLQCETQLSRPLVTVPIDCTGAITPSQQVKVARRGFYPKNRTIFDLLVESGTI